MNLFQAATEHWLPSRSEASRARTPPASCSLVLYGTKLGDHQASPINHTAQNGFYEILPATPGDLNQDGSVDIFDAIRLANAFGSTPSSPNWNLYADINHDENVDIFDAIILAGNFGQTV